MAKGCRHSIQLKHDAQLPDGAEWDTDDLHLQIVEGGNRWTKDQFVDAILDKQYDYIDPREQKLKRLREVIAEREIANAPVDQHYAVARKLCDAIPLSDSEAALIPSMPNPDVVRERLETRVDEKLVPVREQIDAVPGLADRLDGLEGVLRGDYLVDDVEGPWDST